MKKIFLIVFTFLLFLSNLFAFENKFTQEEKDYVKNNKIKVATLPDFPPFTSYKNNKISGLSHDILNLFSKKYNMKFEIEIDNWSNNLNKFKNKEVDVIDTISFTENRTAYTNYTKPYYELPFIIFSRKDLKNYTDISDLKGKKLGLTKDIFYIDEIKKLDIFEIVEFDNIPDKVTALALEKIDIIFGHHLNTQKTIVEKGYTNIKILDELKIKNIKKNDLRFGIAKENKTLYSIFQKALNNISTKEWNDLYSKWITNNNYNPSNKTLNLTKEEKEYIKTKKIIKVQNENNWPPYNYNDKGEAKGFSIDYTKLLASKLNLEVNFIQNHSWDEYLEMLKNKQIDVINNISKNKQRSAYIDFTDIFHTAANAIYVKKGSENIDSLEELRNKTIIMPKGFFAQQLIEKHYPEIKQILVKDSLEALRLLSLGKADATIGKKNVLDYIISTNNISGVVATNFVDDNRLVSLIRMGVPKGEEHLKSILQKAQNSVSDEELLKLKRKWFGGQSLNNKKNESFLTRKEKEYLRKKDEILYCINKDLHPIEFLNTKGEYEGISADIIETLKEKLNVNFKYIFTKSLKQSIEFLDEKRCDIIPAVENNNISLKNISLTHPYLNYKLGIITRKDIPVVPSIEDIIDKPIALKYDSQLIKEFQSNYPDINIYKTKNYHKSLEAVNNNQAYFTLAPLPIASYYMAEFAMTNLYISRYTNISYSINMAVRNDKPILFEILNKAIKDLKNEEKREIVNKWTSFSIEKKFDYSLFWKIFFIVLIIISILLYRQIILNKHNKELKKVNNEIAQLSNTLEQRVQEEIEKNEVKTKQLIQQSRLAQMGELINMIAHQWRQPLTAISATINNLSLKMMLNKDISKEELEKELLLINDYAQHLSGTIDDFRNFYKKDKTRQLVFIENTIEQALSIIKASLSSNLIKIEQDYRCYIKIRTYPTEINHVILNILKNAEDVLKENKIKNPLIKVSTYCDKNNIYLDIANNGGNIKQKDIEKIFEPYFSTKLSKDGTGLGLYMSKVIIEEHCSGTLHVENKDDGVVFKISIPKEQNG